MPVLEAPLFEVSAEELVPLAPCVLEAIEALEAIEGVLGWKFCSGGVPRRSDHPAPAPGAVGHSVWRGILTGLATRGKQAGITTNPPCVYK